MINRNNTQNSLRKKIKLFPRVSINTRLGSYECDQELVGSTTLVTAVILMVTLSLAMLICVFSMAVALRHRAELAADFSALAGAQKMFIAPEMACKVAEDIARRNGAILAECQLKPPDIYVKVAKKLLILHFSLYSEASARAGPAESAV